MTADTPTASSSADTQTASPTATASTSTYALVGSYSTVQVLSPTLVNDIVYCTIQTQPHNVIASIPVQQSVFDQGQSGVQLTNFAQAIEYVMTDPRVIAGVGSQTIGDTGLLADYVVFTVQFIDQALAPNGATALASVGVGSLDFSEALIGQTLRASVIGIIDAVYANLKAAAGG